MKIKIIGPVQRDGKPLAVGDVVNVPESVASELIEAGAAEVEGKQKPAAAPAPASPAVPVLPPPPAADDNGDGSGDADEEQEPAGDEGDQK